MPRKPVARHRRHDLTLSPAANAAADTPIASIRCDLLVHDRSRQETLYGQLRAKVTSPALTRTANERRAHYAALAERRHEAKYPCHGKRFRAYTSSVMICPALAARPVNGGVATDEALWN